MLMLTSLCNRTEGGDGIQKERSMVKETETVFFMHLHFSFLLGCVVMLCSTTTTCLMYSQVHVSLIHY